MTAVQYDLMPTGSPCAVVGVAAPAPCDSRPVHELATTVKRGLVGIVLARLAVNGGIRVVYPFLAVIADGLGVSLEVVAVLVASRSLAGLGGPVIARMMPLHRRRALMMLSQLVVIAGCLLIAVSSTAPTMVRTAVVGVGFVATGVARPLFDLPMQMWVSAHVPAVARGRALGLTELGWALSLAATVPVAGVLIERLGWRSPFVLVAGMAGTAVLTLVLTLPHDRGEVPLAVAPAALATRSVFARTRRVPTGVAVCVGAGLAVAAGEVLLVVYGQWLAEDFGLSVAQIGASTLLIVAAELVGEGVVVAVSDRVGLCRTLFSALLVSAVMYVALGLIGGRVSLAFAVVGILFVAFEVTVVVLIAFASTVVHDNRDRTRLLGALMAAVACGNAVGAVAAPLVFSHGGIALSGAASACAAAMAAAVLWLGSRPNPASG